MKCALYRVVHRESGKDYVGISVTPAARFKDHVYRSKNGSKLLFHRSLAKYGESAFDWKIVAWCSTPDGAKLLEKVAIAIGFGDLNLTLGGEGGHGIVWSDESKKRQSETCKGRQWKEESRAKLSDSLLGNTNRRGKKASIETRAKMSAVRKGRVAWNKGKQMPRRIK